MLTRNFKNGNMNKLSVDSEVWSLKIKQKKQNRIFNSIGKNPAIL
jgi:hypothetical protein